MAGLDLLFPFGKKIMRCEQCAVWLGFRPFWFWLVTTRYQSGGPKLSAKGIWERDGGHCQYTGKKLAPHEGNIDHMVPRSRGGLTSWENCVLADKRINSLKGNRLPEEVGFQLKKNRRRPGSCLSVPLFEMLTTSAIGSISWSTVGTFGVRGEYESPASSHVAAPVGARGM